MDITPFEIYLIMQATGIKISLVFIGSGFAVAALFISMHGAVENEPEVFTCVKRRVIPCALACFILAAILPGTKTLVAMYGIPSALQAADNVELDETAKKSMKAINKLLDSYLEENE